MRLSTIDNENRRRTGIMIYNNKGNKTRRYDLTDSVYNMPGKNDGRHEGVK